MRYIKFFIGPMTQNVIDSCIEFSNETDTYLGFILSRRQIDYDGGYVGYNTSEFIDYVKKRTNKILICRDHSGAYQGKEINCPVFKDKNSFIIDAMNNIDIIHIDPWKKFPDYNKGLYETINNIFHINAINKNILFEVGTEESIRKFDTKEFEQFLGDLKYNLGELFYNIKYAVIQSGTALKETKNVGVFNIDRLKCMVEVCKNFNILSKEHNGDYLSKEEINLRFNNGLNSLNIAPEFGVFETNLLLDNIKNKEHFNIIYKICLDSDKWKKWVSNDFNPNENKRKIIEICGHYVNNQIKEIIKPNNDIIKQKIKYKLKELYI